MKIILLRHKSTLVFRLMQPECELFSSSLNESTCACSPGQGADFEPHYLKKMFPIKLAVWKELVQEVGRGRSFLGDTKVITVKKTEMERRFHFQLIHTIIFREHEI